MKTVLDLINHIAIKAGIPSDDDTLKGLLSNAELTKAVVPDEFSTKIESGLHTIESAKNNKDIRDAMRAQILNGADAEMNALMDELEFDDDTKATMLAEKLTTKRPRLIALQVKQLESAKAAGKGDKGELQTKINELQLQLTNIAKERQAEIAKLNDEKENEIKGLFLRNKLASYNYGLGLEDNEIMVDTAQTIIDKALATNQAKVVRVNGQLQLVANDGTEYFDKATNMKKSIDDFFAGALAPILKKSEAATPTKTVFKANENFTPNQAVLDRIAEQKLQVQD